MCMPSLLLNAPPENPPESSWLAKDTATPSLNVLYHLSVPTCPMHNWALLNEAFPPTTWLGVCSLCLMLVAKWRGSEDAHGTLAESGLMLPWSSS